jgi:threonine dehydrogenase-like Zn-dependent dehydrogenase
MALAVRRATMDAAVVAAPGTARVETIFVPELGPSEVLVQVEGCGVCASSLPTWEGRPWFSYPLEPGAPGHEAWGTLADGTRVAVLTQRGYAGFATASQDEVVPLPASLAGLPFPGEAFACAVMVFTRARVRAGERVAIAGMGFLGRAVAALVKHRGAEVVPVRRDTALDRIRASCDCAIEAAGVQQTLDAAAAVVREGGRLVIAGYHQDGNREIDLGSWNWRGLELVNAHERDTAALVDSMRAAVALAAAGALDVERLVTHRFPLARLADAFEAARTRPSGFVKAVVEP